MVIIRTVILSHVSAGFELKPELVDLQKCCLCVVAVDFQVTIENRQTESPACFHLAYVERE
jgi:hypothetical protein